MTPKKQILVVEDNQLNRELLAEILEEQYTVLQAENGREALEILKLYKERIALVILDIIMPVMDGYTFLDIIKADAELSLIPVIVATQSDSEADELVALSHGATDFVPKPYRPQVILHRVASIIKLRETAAVVNQLQYDRLTGLYSRDFFYQKVKERLSEEPNKEYTIVCSNIENFKLYNDAFGQEMGDRMLKECAENMQSLIGSDSICGRYGADRFLCLLESERERFDRERFTNEFSCSDRPERIKNISVKWGIYEITDRSVPVEQMCDRAFLAADSIKGQYDKFFALYDDALRGKLLREKAITDAMETALTDNQFTVYLQPKYSLDDECMVGAEALVRWIHPEWGFMSPGEFIPLFEKNNFISRLDLYVWERVCALLADWQEKGFKLLPISVNVSRAYIYQSNLAHTISSLTEKYRIEPKYLHLEITESAYAENPNQIINTVAELRRLGFIVEMDDFGSGYSSLNMLSQMKLDVLKLDMKFIQNEMLKPVNQSVISDVVAMAHRLHLSVVAEGVETREQMKRLQAVGCDYVQGYYFARPMPVSEFEKLWEEQRSRAACHFPEKRWGEPELREILVADEDPEYIKKVREAFEGNYRITEAADASAALERIMSDGGEAVSAVILSMTLPRDGASLIMKSLRENPEFWSIPVIATVPSGDRVKSLPLVSETDDFLCKRHPISDLYRRVQRLLEIADSRRRETLLKKEASRDYLTGLLNRRGLKEAVAAVRAEDFPLAVYLFDLDDLKKINDSSGHDMGDRIIRAFAEQLCRCTKRGDILCRYGGDEFAVILKAYDNAEAAEKKGEDICRTFSDELKNEGINASCSGGAVMCEKGDMAFDTVFELVDRALYRAKRENKGGCRQ
ncbi:MAG: EAL domain-containing protein [Acutalibacteraceae bacterium]